MDQAIQSATSEPGAATRIDAATIGGDRAQQADTRILAVVAAARFHGVDLSAADYRPAAGETAPSPASLAGWARDQGLYAKAERVRWKSLFKLQGSRQPAAADRCCCSRTAPPG